MTFVATQSEDRVPRLRDLRMDCLRLAVASGDFMRAAAFFDFVENNDRSLMLPTTSRPDQPSLAEEVRSALQEIERDRRTRTFNDEPHQDDAAAPDVTSTPLGVFTMSHHGGEEGPRFGVDCTPLIGGPLEQFVGIELDALYDHAALGKLFQVVPNSSPVFLNSASLKRLVADLSEPIVVGLIRPEDSDLGHVHGVFLSLLVSKATIARRDGGTSPVASRDTVDSSGT